MSKEKEEKPEAEDKKKDNKTSREAESFKDIETSVEFQDIVNNKQKVLIKIRNNSDKIFSGTVRFLALNVSKDIVGRDTIFVEKLPPEIQTMAITWTDVNAVTSEFEIEGEYSNVPEQKNDYEIVATKPGNHYQTIFIIVPKEKKNLIEIAKELKKLYPDKSMVGFTAFFYTENYREEAADKNFDNAFAEFVVNYNNGLSEITIFENYEKIEVQ